MVVVSEQIKMADQSPASPAPPSTRSWFNSFSQLKQGLKKYGRTGVVTYLALSTCVTAGG